MNKLFQWVTKYPIWAAVIVIAVIWAVWYLFIRKATVSGDAPRISCSDSSDCPESAGCFRGECIPLQLPSSRLIIPPVRTAPTNTPGTGGGRTIGSSLTFGGRG